MKQIKIKKVKVEIDKLVTMAEMGLGVERPLNKEKRGWIAKLKKDGAWDPILVTPIKDSGYYLLTDGWHRVQAATITSWAFLAGWQVVASNLGSLGARPMNSATRRSRTRSTCMICMPRCFTSLGSITHD